MRVNIPVGGRGAIVATGQREGMGSLWPLVLPARLLSSNSMKSIYVSNLVKTELLTMSSQCSSGRIGGE